MTAGADSILSKKIKCASFDISQYPHLGDLTKFLDKAILQLLLDLVEVEAQPGENATALREGEATFDGLAESTAYYLARTATSHPNIIVSLVPECVAALGESLLGGEFKIVEGGKTPSGVDVKLARTFGVNLTAYLSLFLKENTDAGGLAELHLQDEPGNLEELVKTCEGVTYFNISLSATLEGEKPTPIASFHIPASFLEECGLLERCRKVNLAVEDNSQWRADISANIHNTEIDLDIVMDKYKATLSDLASLSIDQIIPLNENAQNNMDINLQTDAGIVTLGKGRLGAFKKLKAVKLTSDLTPPG